MHGNLISFTSDFGNKDGYVGIVKGVINDINQKAKIVDISHDISPYDVRSAAWIIYNSFKYFPDGTVHLVVIDPKVGSAQRRILLTDGIHHFVGPDSGVFSYILKLNSKDLKGYQLQNQKFFLDDVSTSFHARDIFGPVAAHLSAGKNPGQFGPELEISSLDSSYFIEPFVDEKKAIGEIVYIDRFGNLITNIPNDLVSKLVSPKFTCQINEHIISSISNTYSTVSIGELLVFQASHGFLEIARNQDSAVQLLNSKLGDKVVIS